MKHPLALALIGLRSTAVAVLLLLAVACGSGSSQAGITQPSTSPATKQPPNPNLPLLTGPSRIFVYDHTLSNYVADYTVHSQFVLYDDGGVIARFPTLNFGPGNPDGYVGGYTEVNGTIMFSWTDAWMATGTLDGNSLTVRYNSTMQFSDFTDAVYVLAP